MNNDDATIDNNYENRNFFSRNIGKSQVAFLFAVLLFMSIFLSWIKQQDLAVVILYKMFKFVQTDNASLVSIKTAMDVLSDWTDIASSSIKTANLFLPLVLMVPSVKR